MTIAIPDAEKSGGRSVITLDLRGLNCPLPVLKTAKRLAGMAPGDRLLVLASDPMAAIDIPHHCAGAGHRLLAQETIGTQGGGNMLRFEIERGPLGLDMPALRETQ